ncbi:MAG: pantetheine-phosphate adenylyltransferase [Candidatus Saccharibacteria bacterium]
MRIAVYPGSFDPVTNGHIDILERASKIFDKIVIAVVKHVYKNPLFTIEERVELLHQVTGHIPNIEVDAFSGLLVDYIKEKQACAIIRGLRTIGDFEVESQMSMMNKHLYPDAETLFIMSDAKWVFISSSNVKEAALVGGCIHGLVPPLVEETLKEKIKDRLK